MSAALKMVEKLARESHQGNRYAFINRSGTFGYKRSRDLPKVIENLPKQNSFNWRTTAQTDLQKALAITIENISFLQPLVKSQRKLAEKQHWSYDKNRHSQILRCLIGEEDILFQLETMQKVMEAA